ncbi:hypothetical protein [Lacinutrix chionoecetis]
MNIQSTKLFCKKILLLIVVFCSALACQNENSDITPPNNQDIIIQDSALGNALVNLATLDGSLDNVIDNANCILVNLPVTVMINGVEFTIDSIEDYEVIEAIFNEFDTDNDDIEIVFPIVITLNDYTQVDIANYTELESFIEQCSGENEDDDDIECIDFQYPISFSIYDANFQLTETVVINNDEALYNFIANLSGGVLASLNFPVTMILSDGSTVVVNNNEELEIIIAEAADDCDEDDDNDWDDDNYDCTEDNIVSNLLECYWVIVAYNGNDTFIQYDIEFHANGAFEMHEGSATSAIGGAWEMSVSNDGLPELVITQLTAFQQDLIGSWVIIDCDADRLELVNGNNTMVMEQDCNPNENPFTCFESFDAEIVVCDDNGDGFGVFDLNTVFANCETSSLTITFHETLVDAQVNVNVLLSPYNNIIVSQQTIFARVEMLSTGNFEIFEVDLIVENCNPSGCTESDVDVYLVECIWNVVNYNGSNDLITYDLDFDANGTLLITGNGQAISSTWSTSQTSDGVWVEFTGVNGPNIQAISGNWLIVECESDRLQMDQGSNTMVIEQDCTSNNTCTEGDVDGILQECEWTITSYAGDTGFNIFNINFTSLTNAIIYTPNSTEDYTMNWSTVGNGNQVTITFSNISGGNVQVLNGDYIVVECTADQLILHDVNNSNNELVLDKDCN